MKTYNTSSALAHAYAHQLTIDGKNPQRSMFFERGIIYSYGYHFPIARKVNNTFVFTLDSYSSTTTKHKGHVLSAISHCNVINAYDIIDIDKNEAIVTQIIQTMLERLATARNKTKWIMQIVKEAQILEALYSLFGFEIQSQTIKGIINQKEAYFQTDYGIGIINEIAAKIKSQKTAKLERVKAEISDFKMYQRNSVSDGNNAYLRVSGDFVQTSKGINIEKKEAYNLMKLWISNPKALIGQKFQYYTINACDHKTIKIGCHTISISEAIEIAKNLNWDIPQIAKN